MSAAKFAEKNGISEKALRWWKWNLTSESRSRGGKTRRLKKMASLKRVSPLTFVEMTSAMHREPIEIVLASGVRIRVPADFDASALDRLLGAIGCPR
jgi:hypothetical protein